MNNISFGTKIRAARERKKMTQREFASLIGANSVKVVSAWENDRNKPDIDTTVKICEVLDISLDYLFGISNEDAFQNMSPKEINIISDYRLLDELGQWVVDYNISMQKKRCSSVDADTIGNPTIIPVDSSENIELFIEKNDVRYQSAKEKAKNLKVLKKKSYISYDNLHSYLCCGGGLNRLITIADLILIMHGIKIPSDMLYHKIESYLKLHIIKE